MRDRAKPLRRRRGRSLMRVRRAGPELAALSAGVVVRPGSLMPASGEARAQAIVNVQNTNRSAILCHEEAGNRGGVHQAQSF